MRYFRLLSTWQRTGSAEGGWLLTFPESIRSQWALTTGNPVADWNDQVFASIAHDGPHVDFPGVVGNWHVMSDRMRAVVARYAPSDVEFLAIRIRSAFGEIVPQPYFIANYLRKLHVIDRRRLAIQQEDVGLAPWGDYDIEEDVEGQPRLVLDEGLIGDVCIFRIFGQSDVVVVREDLRQAALDAGLSGCAFLQLATS